MDPEAGTGDYRGGRGGYCRMQPIKLRTDDSQYRDTLPYLVDVYPFFLFLEEKLLLLFIRIPITFYITIHYYIYTRLANPNGAFDTVV